MPIAVAEEIFTLSQMDRRRNIEVLPYVPIWVTRYEDEASRLHVIFGGAILAIHHIGSTAVPGMKAKPTVDILAVVGEEIDIPSFDHLMEKEGYLCRGEALDAVIPGTPGRFYYVRKQGVDHLTHVHVCANGHFQINELLVLRDYLRAHPDRADSYGCEKAELSSRFTNDNIGYMNGKDACVRALIHEAVNWRKGTNADLVRNP